MIELYQSDCRKMLERVWDRVDVVIMDPPYGISLSDHDPKFSRRKLSATIEGDNDQSSGQAVLDWCAVNGLPTATFASPYKPWPGKWRNLLVWDKGSAVGRGGAPKLCWKRTYELIQVDRNKPLRTGRDEAVLRFPITPDKFSVHPAVKPVALMQYLVEQLSAPGETVFDPFMGSGSTGLAAVACGRSFIGCEIDPVHFRTAKKRINAAADGLSITSVHVKTPA